MKNSKFILVILAIAVFGIIYGVISLTQNVGKTSSTVNMEQSAKKLNELYKDINVRTIPTQRGAITTGEEQITILPDISEYPFVVNPATDNFITIYASYEKAQDEDSWLCKVAEQFNKSATLQNGTRISVGIRAIPSNLASDFIITEKYTPDVYMPSSSTFGLLLNANEKKNAVVTDSLTHNVSGIVISRKVKDSINSKYKNTEFSTIINSVINGECLIGYTNPLSNEDGLNFILAMLNAFDNTNPLGETAINKLKIYQDKIPYVSYDILQLQESLKNGSIDGFAINYHDYYLNPSLRNSFDFIPCGIRQDQPVYSLGELSGVKQEIIQKFVEYCKNTESQKLASNDGFNALDDYSYSGFAFNGNDVLEVQKLWKKEKNGSSDLTAIFVADVSGSMEGSPLLKLKASLNRAATFIGEDTNIGLVTFSDTVNIVLPIAKFDDIQKSYFSNAVKSMRAGGSTAMFDAIVVAEKMLIDEQNENPNTRLMLFVLTDGESNRGYGFNDIEDVTRGLRIPVYTIGYNADIDVLQEVSDINEASTMDADSDNVIYKLESLFNAQM